LGLSSLIATYASAISGLYADTAERDWSSISGRYHAVFDISSDSDHPPNILVKTGTQTPHQLSNLPPQTPNSCRVYIVHEAVKDVPFIQHVEQLIPGPFASFYDGSTHSIEPPFNRRLEGDQLPWWQDGIYTFGHNPSPEGLFEGISRCHTRVRCVWREDRILCCLCPIPSSRQHYTNKMPRLHILRSRSCLLQTDTARFASRSWQHPLHQ
jgi:hypothetical protein